MRSEVMGSWKKIHHNLYSTPDIIRAIESKNLRWTGHTAQRKATRNSRKLWSENLQGGYHVED